MSNFLLRLKTKEGPRVIEGLSSTDKISELKNKISSLTGLSTSNLNYLCGYPPKLLDLSNDQLPIDSSGLKSGDTLIVEEKSKSTTPTNTEKNQEALHHIRVEQSNSQGILMRRTVPSDNSCLFTSIGFVIGGKVDTSCGSLMRQIIATDVASNEDEFSEAILGKPNKDYCKWILKPDSWGGAIELAVLSRFYGIEIAVVDTINGIINRFGEDHKYGQRVFLIFDGIHYDPLYLEKVDFDGRIQTIFPSDDDHILAEAQQLASEAKISRQYTDVHNFTLKCLVCQKLLTGQIQAQQHAKTSGHTDFGEIAS